MNHQFQNLLGAPYRGGNLLFHGSTNLLSPAGNRVTVVDLSASISHTLPFEASRDIRVTALSPDGVLLVAVDEEGRAKLVNAQRKIVIHHFSFKSPVSDLKFSPDGRVFAAAVGRALQIWQTPELKKSFAPLRLLRTYKGTHDKISALGWSPDGRWIVAACRDFTARIFSRHALKGFKAVTLTGHRDVLVGAFFKPRSEGMGVYTVSRDGALFSWKFEAFAAANGAIVEERQNAKRRRSEASTIKGGEEAAEGREERQGQKEEGEEGRDGGAGGSDLSNGNWTLESKNFFMQAGAHLTSCDFLPAANILVAGFSSGVFGIYQLPDFSTLQLLSVSSESISSVAVNAGGDWVAVGSAKMGQLLVWEWRSEAYVMKAQGHRYDVNAIAFSPDGALLATAADDAKLKVWNTTSGFCFVTLTDHSMPITAVAFHPSGHSLFSASLDGTVRAFDLTRYRNFRTLTSPTPVQFSSLALHPSGDIVCASTQDDFQIYVWAVKTGRLLDILGGHEGPVHCLAFSPTREVLASGSWDGSVRLWDVFESKGATETFHHNHNVLAIAYRPDGRQIACATLDGQIHFWNATEGEPEGVIEGRRDIAGGRRAADRRTAENSSSAGKCFRSLAYSTDGEFLLAAGNSRFICCYHVADKVLIRRIAVTSNQSLDGILPKLSSKRMTDAGPLDLLDADVSDDDDVESNAFGAGAKDSLGLDMPGADVDSLKKGGRVRGAARVKVVCVAGTGQMFAAATPEGVMVYSLDEDSMFEPSELDMEVTPEAIVHAMSQKLHGRALHMALRLNDAPLLQKALLSIPKDEMSSVVTSIPRRYLPNLLRLVSEQLAKSGHLEFLLLFCKELFFHYGRFLATPRLAERQSLRPILALLSKNLGSLHEDLASVCSSNLHLLEYLTSVDDSQETSTVDTS